MYLDEVYHAWHWESDAESMEAFQRFFRHARFKKGSKTTVQNSYQPTPGEVQLTQASGLRAKGRAECILLERRGAKALAGFFGYGAG